jgi:5-methylcytosine-specific restriction endonuclease McrA
MLLFAGGAPDSQEVGVVSEVLNQPALVLNRNWQPVNVASVARALTLVFSDHARVVEPNEFQLYDWDDWAKLQPQPGEPFIQAVSMRIRVPEVISLLKFDRLPSTHVAFNRRNIFKRDRHTCQYCGRRPFADELTIDHIVPRSQGGTSSWTNCVLACMNCNHRKADRSVEQAGLKLRRSPIQPAWNPIYWRNSKRIDSWQKFISDAYWNTELDD